MAEQSNLRGIGAILLATGAFVANDSCMKLALSDAPPLQVLIMRGIAACLWCLPILLILGHGRDLPKVFNRWVVLRSLCEVFAILSFILALNEMPIADITAIAQIAPLLVLLGIWLFFGDRIGMLRLALIGVGITGALLVAQPGSEAASPMAILGFFTALGAAGRDIVTRKVPPGTPALIVTFSTLLIVMLCATVGSFAFETQVAPTFRHAWLMAIAGFFLMCGHLFVFLAFRIGAGAGCGTLQLFLHDLGRSLRPAHLQRGAECAGHCGHGTDHARGSRRHRAREPHTPGRTILGAAVIVCPSPTRRRRANRGKSNAR